MADKDENHQSHQVKVLLIEDNPGDARLIQEILSGIKDSPFNIEHADMLSKGLERLAAGGIDIILLDLGLPDSQGIKTLTSTLAAAHSMPIVVLTGLADEKMGMMAVQEGAQDYLKKGLIDGNVLARTLSHAIVRKRSEVNLKNYAKELEEKLKMQEETGVSRYASLIKARNSYLLKEKHYGKSMAIISNLTKCGLAGLCLTSTHPDVLKETCGLKDFKCRTVWISTAGSEENIISPSNLTSIHGKVNEFVKNNKNSIVLLLGLENLITLNGFERSLNFINSLIDTIILNNSRFILTVNPEAMIPRELSLIEKSFIEIKDYDLIMLGLK